MEEAAITAIENPGLVVHVDGAAAPIAFEIVDEWLSMILPGGKRIWYYNPMLVSAMPQWHRPETREACRAGDCNCQPRAQVSYMSQKNGQWKRVRTYGGKFTENVTQATRREIMMPAALRLEEAGYPIILIPYDEAVTEPPQDFGSAEELKEIMAIMPEFAETWPITVDAWSGERYRK